MLLDMALGTAHTRDMSTQHTQTPVDIDLLKDAQRETDAELKALVNTLERIARLHNDMLPLSANFLRHAANLVRNARDEADSAYCELITNALYAD